jgi:hypothetical protein
MVLTRSQSLRFNPATEEVSVSGAAAEPQANTRVCRPWNRFAMEDADDTLPRSVISASRAAAAHQKPPVAPALANQVTEASERFSVSTAEPARFIPLPETDSPSAMEIDQKAATSAETPQSASAATQSITHSEPVSATSLDVEPPLVLTPLAFKSRRARISSINAATSLPQHLESHPPMPADAPTPRKPVSLAGKKQEKTCDVDALPYWRHYHLVLFVTSVDKKRTKVSSQSTSSDGTAKCLLLGLHRNPCCRSPVRRTSRIS